MHIYYIRICIHAEYSPDSWKISGCHSSGLKPGCGWRGCYGLVIHVIFFFFFL